jgi:hypothetical protein
MYQQESKIPATAGKATTRTAGPETKGTPAAEGTQATVGTPTTAGTPGLAGTPAAEETQATVGQLFNVNVSF